MDQSPIRRHPWMKPLDDYKSLGDYAYSSPFHNPQLKRVDQASLQIKELLKVKDEDNWEDSQTQKGISRALEIDSSLVCKVLDKLKNKGEAHSFKCYSYGCGVGHTANQRFWFRTTEEERREILRLPP